MKSKPPTRWRLLPGALWITGIASLFALWVSVAQQPTTATIRNFNVFPGDYYPAPHASQPKSQLQGAEGVRLSPEQVRITNSKLTTFKEDGSREVVIQAPECIYDDRKRSVGSAGPLEMRTADGKFLMEGAGFTWQQTNSIIFISNEVHTVIQADLLAQPAGATPGQTNRQSEPLEIFSRRFDYGAETGEGNYREQVRVLGTNLSVTSDLLTVKVPMKERQLQTITAAGNVALDYSGVKAGGEHAIWNADTGLAHLTGNPHWATGQREGRAEELVIDATNRVLYANRDASLKMTGQSFGALGLNQTNTSSATTTNHDVEIFSDRYQISTNAARFSKNVRARETAAGQLRTTMECGELTVSYQGTNQLERMVAEQGVRIEQEDQRLMAGNANYTGTNGLLELLDNPSWRSGAREGRGDRILVAATDNELSVYGNAYLKLPAREAESALGRGAAPGQVASNQFAEIFCREYIVRPQVALLEGNVRMEHPQMKMQCDHLSFHSDTNKAPQQRLLAEHSVVFDLLSQSGQKLHGTCQEALYEYAVIGSRTNDLLKLTGDPVLETTNGSFANPVLLVDRTQNKLMAQGPYRIKGKLDMVNTNKFPFVKR